MLTLLAAAVLGPITYQIPNSSIGYEVKVDFSGFLPIFGGQEGTAEISLGVQVIGLSPDDEKRPRAQSELTAAKVKFMGETLPFTIDNVTQYFPKTTFSYLGSGKIVKTDAPDIALPIRLPGLDVKRFPDVTYMPIEFPESEVEVGTPWKFKKKLGESEAEFSAKVSEVKGDIVTIDVEMVQAFEDLENESLEVVKSEKDAVTRVSTKLSGVGKVLFDRQRGLLVEMNVTVDSVSLVHPLKGGDSSERRLKTNVSVKIPKPK